MIFWLLVLILVFVSFYHLFHNGWTECIMSFVVGVFLLGLFTLITSLEINFPEETDWKPYSKGSIPIVSLRTQETMQGSFVLGSGTIGSHEKYYFMTKLESNTYKRENSYTEDTIIKETNDENPNFSWTWEIYKVETTLWPKMFISDPIYRKTKFVLTVPKGTVIQKFNSVE